MFSRNLLWVVIVVTILSIVIDIPNFSPTINFFGRKINISFPLKLGLDLKGGTQLILQADTSEIALADQDAALESAREVIERRVNSFGVSEARVQTSKLGNNRRILVDLPGLKDSSAAAQLVGKTAKLDFRELIASGSAQEATPSGELVPTGLTGADLVKAQVVFGSGAKAGPQISLRFNSEGTKRFAEITKRNIGKPLCIFLDDQLIEDGCPIVEQEINGGDAVITGRFTTEKAKELAIQLNAGALRVPISIIDQRSVGPELGQQSINKSLVAGGIGILIVVFYMAAYYGIWGIIADLALLIYALSVLAIFKTGLFIFSPITLSLAGIAAFILSIGMAVDANILIFERMKEEIRWGKNRKLALELGFNRAWTSIWASNVSSLITAAILYSMGASLVKGFAITLAIGVLVSMFTAIIVTKTFLKIIIR